MTKNVLNLSWIAVGKKQISYYDLKYCSSVPEVIHDLVGVPHKSK